MSIPAQCWIETAQTQSNFRGSFDVMTSHPIFMRGQQVPTQGTAWFREIPHFSLSALSIFFGKTGSDQQTKNGPFFILYSHSSDF